MRSDLLMWQETDDKFVFRFQTDDTNVHRHMSQTKGFMLVGRGVNVNLWIYRVEFSSVENAKKNFRVFCS